VDAPRTTLSPTGDPRMDQLLPLAERAIQAAHRQDRLGIGTAVADAADLYDGDEPAALRALVVLLAGACPDDEPVADLLLWRRNPTEYARLRARGFTATEARELVGRLMTNIRVASA